MRNVLKIVFFLGFAFCMYLSIGYYSKGMKQPVLIGSGEEYHFWGFYILAIVYGVASFLCILCFVLSFVIRKKKNSKNFGI